MAEYKIKNILEPNLLPGKTDIAKFINSCKEKQLENVTPIELDNGKTKAPKKTALYQLLEDNKEEPLCYEVSYNGKSYITFHRKALEILTKSNFKTMFTGKTITGLLSKLSTQYNSSDFFELISLSGKKTTIEKQDFTCYAVWYFFNNRTASIYDFYENIKQTSDLLSNNKSKLSVSSTSDELKEFSLLINYPYVLDSVTVAKTLITHRGKLNIRGSLSSYSVAEEDSAEGIRYKSIPFKKIALTQSNYYNAPDKLTTADMFLYRSQSPGLKKLNLVFSGTTLTHIQYQKFIDTGFKDGDIIPISLKQLKLATISDNITTNLVKVIGSLVNVNEKVKDPFFSTVVSLMAIKNKQDFINKMEEVIEINQNSFDYKLKDVGRTTFEFNINFVDYDKSTRYQAFLQSGQIYLTPIETTGSASGIGGIARDYVNSQIIKNLPEKNIFFRELIKIRRETFEEEINFNGRQIELKLRDITVDFTDILPGLTYTKPSLIKQDEVTQTLFQIILSVINNKPIVLNPKLKADLKILKKIKTLDDEKLIAEAIKLGISDKKTIISNLNNTNMTLLKQYKINLVKKIYSKSELNKHTQLVNVVVQLKLLDKNTAIKMTVKELADLVSDAKAYKALKNYPALMKSDLLSPGSLHKIFLSIPQELRPIIAERYIVNITKHMGGKSREILNDYQKEFASKKDFLKNINTGNGKVTFSENTSVFFERVSSYEMLYLCSANESVIKKWIKNSFIMSVYALAAAYGVIIFDGKKHKIGDAEQFGKMARKNPIYVKIGE